MPDTDLFFFEKLAGALLYHIGGKQSSYSNYIITLLRPLRLKNIEKSLLRLLE